MFANSTTLYNYAFSKFYLILLTGWHALNGSDNFICVYNIPDRGLIPNGDRWIGIPIYKPRSFNLLTNYGGCVIKSSYENVTCMTKNTKRSKWRVVCFFI